MYQMLISEDKIKFQILISHFPAIHFPYPINDVNCIMIIITINYSAVSK